MSIICSSSVYNSILIGRVCLYHSLTLYIAVTYPLDLTKTRLQIQGEVAAAQNNNINVSIRMRKLILMDVINSMQ